MIKQALICLLIVILPVISGLAQDKHSGPVYPYPDQQPKTAYDMMGYIDSNLHYPKEAKKKGIQGRVIVKFIVNEDGEVSDAEVIRGIGGGCDEEAKRVITTMPAWISGKSQGKPVRTYYTIPIIFSLN